ncbi:MAG: ArsC/Spx/MgsR family protein [Pseudomonadota bacterium]
MKLYGIKTCDTCRKARKALSEAEFVDLRAEPLPADVRNAALDQFGAALLNKSSTTWRGLTEEERAGDPRALLAAHPTLMKRPLIVDGATMTIGWKADAQAVWL